jgi:hypothetical protein
VAVEYVLAADEDGYRGEEAVVVQNWGRKAAVALWELLRSVPKTVGASSEAEFLFGHAVYFTAQPAEAEREQLAKWQGWLGKLYAFSIEPKLGDADRSLPADPDYASRFLTEFELLFSELDPFLNWRMRVWTLWLPAAMAQ